VSIDFNVLDILVLPWLLGNVWNTARMLFTYQSLI